MALSAAEYPELWGGRGYPPRLQIATLAGSIVHLALEIITKRLVQAGVPSQAHPLATQVLRDLGGFTKIVRDCLERVLARFSDNPRAMALLDRRIESNAVLAKLETWVREQVTLKTLSIGKAAAYVIANWTRLTLFVDDPRIPLDNNSAEAGSAAPSSGERTTTARSRGVGPRSRRPSTACSRPRSSMG